MNERQTILEVSIKAFKHNVEEIKKVIGPNKDIMYVMKANAYGTYLNKNIELIKDFKMIATALVSEGIELRNSGYTGEIFVLNQPYIEDIKNILNYHITVGVASFDFIKELAKYNEDVTIHIELETGMGRTGFNIKDLDKVLTYLKKTNIKVEGVYTHLSSADSDKEFTDKQIDIFKEGVNTIKKYYPNIKYIHAEASCGILYKNDDFCNLVRPGMLLYGYNPTDQELDFKLEPTTKLKSKISFIKEVDKDTSISYGRTFITDKKMKIATIGIGYADGLKRSLSNTGEVVIDGKLCKIVGRVCMDSFMADVSNIPNVKVGDYVYIWDNKNITLEDVANKCNTINYEILSTISNRIPRVFID